MHIISIRCFFILLLCNCLLGVNAYGQAQWWQRVANTELQLSNLKEINIATNSERYIRLDSDMLIKQLKEAEQQRTYEISIPNLQGEEEIFLIREAKIMEKGLKEKYPDIRAYRGHAKDNYQRQIRIDRNLSSVHFSISGPKAQWYIDPAFRPADDQYIIYQKQEFEEVRMPICQHNHRDSEHPTLQVRSAQTSIENFVQEYRLAVSASYDYFQFFGGTIEGALGGIVTTMNRVNMVYEKDLGIRMVLVADNDTLIVTDPEADFFTIDGNESFENQSFIDSRIGVNNYDVGHIFGVGDGGVASLGSVCENGEKAQGFTGLSRPEGDPFDIDFVAHELGHQFGANHTFNGLNGSCGAQRFPPTAFEPGAGTTIMGYAGICGIDNITPNSSDYFHGGSIEEIFQYAIQGSGASCAVLNPVDNTAPLISLPEDGQYLPYLTPFELEASAEDLEGDDLTYCWEQIDRGTAAALGAYGNGNAALFRSFPPTDSPKRTFPRLSDLLDNRSQIFELLPNSERDLNFQLTVRDNRIDGGALSWGTVSYQVTDEAGPFRLENPAPFFSGSYLDLKWDVANTNLPPVNTDSVIVLISEDGGLNFDIEIATLANTGSAFVYIPEGINTVTGRIKIKAKDNIYFDINDNNISIQPATLANPEVEILGNFDNLNFCSSDEIKLPFVVNLLGDISSDTTSLSVRSEGFNVGLTPISDEQNAFSLELLGGENLAGGNYQIELIAQNGNLSDSLSFPVMLLSAGSQLEVTLVEPFEQNNLVSLQPSFSWTGDPLADTYQLELATDSDFNNISFTSELLTDTQLELDFSLLAETEYYWRVIARNEICGISSSSIAQSFTTEGVICEIFSPQDLPIAFNNLPFIQSTLDVDRDVTILDVNVLNIEGSYPMPNQGLSFRLRSPQGPILEVVRRNENCIAGDTFSFSLDDQAAINIIPCPNDRGLSVQPDASLSTFNGQNAAGRWFFNIFDDGGEGQLTNWALEICYGTSAVTSTNDPLDKQSVFKVYPNPSNSLFNFQLSRGTLDQLLITDIAGRVIFQARQIKNTELELDASNWKAGIYIYSMLNEEGEIYTGKLVKQ